MGTERIDEHKKSEMLAKQYIERIIFGLSRFQQHGSDAKPLIFMSKDVFDVLVAEEEGVYVDFHYQTILGHNIDIVRGSTRLYLGYDLM